MLNFSTIKHCNKTVTMHCWFCLKFKEVFFNCVGKKKKKNQVKATQNVADIQFYFLQNVFFFSSCMLHVFCDNTLCYCFYYYKLAKSKQQGWS